MSDITKPQFHAAELHKPDDSLGVVDLEEDAADECICGFVPSDVLLSDHHPECKFHECGEDVCCCAW